MPRKLKLQMQMTIDGFAAGPDGQLDWMTRNLDGRRIRRAVPARKSRSAAFTGRRT